VNRERILLVVRFALVVVFGGVIGFMLARAWVPRSAAYSFVYNDVASLFDFGPGLAIEKFSSSMIGLYVGILSVFTLDWRKRVQGMLLFVGTAIALLVMARFGVLLPNIQPTIINGVFFLGGLFAAFVTQFGELQRQLSRRTPLDELEFDRAIIGVFALFAVIPLLGLFQSLAVGTSITLLDVPFTAAFVYTLFGFISYDSTINTAILGPQSSGKTMMILGLFQRFTERDDTPVRPTSALSNLADRTDRMRQGDDFPATHTIGADNEIGFYFQVGELFPMQARFSTLDHAGELIDDIAAAVENGAPIRTRLALIIYWIQDRLPSQELTSQVRRELFYQHVRTASMVVLVVDVQRLIEGDEPYLDELQTIAGELNERNANIRVVATKCDLLMDSFTNQSRVINDPEQDEVLYADGDTGYTSFSEWVTNTLTGQSIQVKNLMKETDDDIIYPVWFRTVEEDGARIPDLDENDNLQPAGFDVLVDELEEEALRNVRV
jgi:GTPase SAR1 family protein